MHSYHVRALGIRGCATSDEHLGETEMSLLRYFRCLLINDADVEGGKSPRAAATASSSSSSSSSSETLGSTWVAICFFNYPFDSVLCRVQLSCRRPNTAAIYDVVSSLCGLRILLLTSIIQKNNDFVFRLSFILHYVQSKQLKFPLRRFLA